ncbi:MAG TPA: septal ring lytic transglycosylase RlpA family protein [Methylomirabilota bacterium]|nr:septal ring lytic transglycosylase RlpA family protein [Methylomirabilota bacterium]
MAAALSGGRRAARLAGAATLAVAAAGCAAATRPAPPAPVALVGHVETGQASWYGRPHHGRRTASGEVYDMYRLTAAHRSLPFGTRVLVTNLANRRTVEVRVNDRGPFKDGRVLDLSYAAALALGAAGAGVVDVRLQVVAVPSP